MKKSVLRNLLHAGLALFMLAAAGLASAEYPERPIKLVVAYPPGGGADYISRQIAAVLEKKLGQPVVVDNRPGASGLIAAQYVAKAPADGYTLFNGDIATLSFNSVMFKELPYEPLKSFDFISMIAKLDMLLMVNANSPIRTVDDFLRMARAPSANLSYGSPGQGTPHHVGVEFLLQEAKFKAQPVQYRGVAPVIQDVLSGQVQFAFIDLAAGLPQINGGKLRALAVASASRLAALPDVPTFAEAGIPNFESYAWQAIVTPAGVPKDVASRIGEAVRATMADEGLRSRFLGAGVQPLSSNAEQVRRHIVSENAKWYPLMTARNIQVQ